MEISSKALFIVIASVFSFCRCMDIHDIKPDNVNEIFSDAVKTGNLDLTQILLSNPNLCKLTRASALFTAIENRQLGILQLLLADQRIDPININLAVIAAIQKGDLELTKMLISDGRVNTTAINRSLSEAARFGHLDLFKLLYADPRVGAIGLRNAFESAAGSGQMEIFETLFKDRRVDPAANYNASIRAASLNNRYDIVTMLLHHPAVDPHFARFLRPDLINPKRSETIRLVQIARQFYHNTLEDFMAKRGILIGLSKDELDMLLIVNGNNMNVFMYICTFASSSESSHEVQW